MKFHYFIGRVSSPLQVAFFFIYNHIFHVLRARVVVWNERGELLLVRNWGGKQQWGLPGGGVERRENPAMAAKRELYEEVGVSVPLTHFTYITTLHYQYEAPIYSVTIMKTDMPDKPHNPWEITAIKWFSPSQLPPDISPLVALALKKLSKSD